MNWHLRASSLGLVALTMGVSACTDALIPESTTDDATGPSDDDGGDSADESDSSTSSAGSHEGATSAEESQGDTSGADVSPSDSDDGDDDGSDSGTDTGPGLSELALPSGADILFVVDNSWSMGEEQAALAKAFHQLTDELHKSRREIDYRIAVTSTDNGHKSCSTKPGQGGQLKLHSCRDREDAFTDPAGQFSRYNTACAGHCEFTDDHLIIAPTTTDQDAESKSRPWVQMVAGLSNLPDEVSVPEAMACFAPLGINGCGYEAQLESMYRAIGLSLEKNQPSYDFMRRGAVLHMVHVTDEADCSYNHKAAGTSAIFDADNMTFWANPDVGPTSSICWNAGVRCSGEINGYYEACEATDKDVSGQPIDDPDADDAALFPFARYRRFIDAVATQKAELGIRSAVSVSLIAGVSPNGRPEYPTGKGTAHFDQFGIGAGCVGRVDILAEKDPATGETVPAEAGLDSYAVPPVRLKAFADAYRDAATAEDFSICRSTFDVAMKTIGEQIADRFQPYCVQYCVADSEPNSPWVDADCRATSTYRDTTVEVPECTTQVVDVNGHEVREYVLDDQGRFRMPDDSDTCFTMHGDRDEHTPSTFDDLATSCEEQGFNLSAMIHFRYGKPARPGTDFSLGCERSPNMMLDCPDLG